MDNNCSRINRAQLEYSPVEALNNHREKSCMQNLSFIKAQMIRQVLPFRDEARNGTCHGGSQVVMESSAPMIMELFPQSTGFAASISGAARQKSPASKFIQETVLTPASVQSQQWSFLSPGSVQNSVIYRPASAMAPASKSTTTPLTIFYNGSVNVYDVAPEKAQAIMILARSAISNCKGSSSPTITYSGPSSSNFISIEGPTEPFTGVAAQQRAVCKLNSGLPIARNQSLQRFLEKRKERVSGTSPYTTKAILMETPGHYTSFL